MEQNTVYQLCDKLGSPWLVSAKLSATSIMASSIGMATFALCLGCKFFKRRCCFVWDCVICISWDCVSLFKDSVALLTELLRQGGWGDGPSCLWSLLGVYSGGWKKQKCILLCRGLRFLKTAIVGFKTRLLELQPKKRQTRVLPRICLFQANF